MNKDTFWATVRSVVRYAICTVIAFATAAESIAHIIRICFVLHYRIAFATSIDPNYLFYSDLLPAAMSLSVSMIFWHPTKEQMNTTGKFEQGAGARKKPVAKGNRFLTSPR
jgi:hypothetical protein